MEDSPLRREGMLRSALDETGDEDGAGLADDSDAAEGRWVTRGGVVQWEEPDTRDVTEFPNLREDAASRWAENDIMLPLGAPERLRVRAMRAWLARSRLREDEAQGMLLLERRRLFGADGADENDPDATVPARRRRASEEHPLDLALAERQASSEEYERLLEALEDLRAHSGADRTLVEFYLLVTDRLATLAAEPAAASALAAATDASADENAFANPLDRATLLALLPEGQAPTPDLEHPLAPRAVREWHGRTHAVLQARRHTERLTAPEPEE
ncbi:MAG TPA: hypothetical protein VKQ36_12010 [Ktedonobacterales bacterium]|nr:hypothetical protein [Ktedonobacterales bacterium]